MIKTNREDIEEEDMRKKQTIPIMCRQCRWHDVLGCMYYGELRENFNPGIKCFQPKKDLSYPNPRNIVNQFFKIFYNSFSRLEYEFITKTEEYEDGSKFLSVLSENISLLEKFKKKFLILQKEFRKYSQSIETDHN